MAIRISAPSIGCHFFADAANHSVNFLGPLRYSSTGKRTPPLASSPKPHAFDPRCACARRLPPARVPPMTDRCSNLVAFPSTYDGKPSDQGTVILDRGENGSSEWSQPFTVQTDGSGHIRWWCHSSTRNISDLATQGELDPSAVPGCVIAAETTIVADGSSSARSSTDASSADGSSAGLLTSSIKVIKLCSSAWNGWTPERLRCSDHSTRIRARVRPDRLLQTECLGR